MSYPKRPIEVDQPIKGIPAPARREKSIRPGDIAAVKALLEGAAKQLRAVMRNPALMAESPVEVQSAIESAAYAIGSTCRRLESSAPKTPPAATNPGGPTRQQGQFLAFIRQYIMRNGAGVAPTHSALQRFFNLTAPSVNSMLVRLEHRGFIRRIPRKARAIEIICPLDWIPPLERPFKF